MSAGNMKAEIDRDQNVNVTIKSGIRCYGGYSEFSWLCRDYQLFTTYLHLSGLNSFQVQLV